ncbi:MAG: transglycosylase SLT domain-containing protein [Bdellovibrio sp.]|nr:transglycosylase SLT domain-containing protein [Bdellovibrio sp.]
MMNVSQAQAPLQSSLSSQTWTSPDFYQVKAIGYDEKTFSVPDSLKEDVDFWVKIYTKYSTQQGIFHVVGDKTQVLGEIDLSQVYVHAGWSAIRKEKEAELIVRIQKRLLAQKYKIANVRSIRLQMGLRDRMADAIKLSGYYLPMMEKIFAEQKIPKELTRVVFVESSFNILAQSKVGASGLWQIMPAVSKKFKYISKAQDLRNHPLYATKLAAIILKQNYQILKSWPLAVTAYNHGVGSLGKLVRKYHSNDIGYLIENVSAKKSFGFASRNFYATFLAALHVESNANLYFPEPVFKYSELLARHLKLTKKLPYEELLAIFDGDRSKLKLYNPHLKNKFLKPGQLLPEGVIATLPEAASQRLADSAEVSF